MSNKSSLGSQSWKKINEERKRIKKKQKQELLIRKLEKSKKLEELSKLVQNEEETKKSVSTVSIAVPGSILENAQSAELRAYLAGQIARAACIFRIDEVVIFDDVGINNIKESKVSNLSEDESSDDVVRASCLQLARILQYLECPQYLRKFFFPLHKDLKYSGLLNPLDAPHHLRQQNIFIYREGVVTDKKVKEGKGSYVNVGLLNDVLINKPLTPGLRVTVRIDHQNVKKIKGLVVPPNEPRQKTGVYWGYSVRIAHKISEIFTKCPYEGGYDLTIGTSDKGCNVHDVEKRSLEFNHALVVFGGLKGLEAALELDEKLKIDDPKLLFDHYYNILPSQGSRTIRTEEAILIALSVLHEKFKPQVDDIEFSYGECIPQSGDTGIKSGIASNIVLDSDLSRFD